MGTSGVRLGHKMEAFLGIDISRWRRARVTYKDDTSKVGIIYGYTSAGDSFDGFADIDLMVDGILLDANERDVSMIERIATDEA